MDPDRRGEDESAARGTRRGSGPTSDERAATTSPLNEALDEAQERQLEQEEADVAAEDRVGHGGRAVGRERHAVRSRAGPSPTRPASEPPMVRAISTATTITRPTPASGVRSGRSSASKTSVRGSPNGRRNRGRRRPPASAACAASLTRSIERRRPARSGRRRRAQPAGEPEVAEQDHEGEHQPPTNSSACAPTRVQNTPIEADARDTTARRSRGRSRR